MGYWAVYCIIILFNTGEWGEISERKRCKKRYLSKVRVLEGNAKARRRQSLSRKNKQTNAEVAFGKKTTQTKSKTEHQKYLKRMVGF